MLITAHSLKSQKWGYMVTETKHRGLVNTSLP